MCWMLLLLLYASHAARALPAASLHKSTKLVVPELPRIYDWHTHLHMRSRELVLLTGVCKPLLSCRMNFVNFLFNM
jgi:hypothetical protein